MAVCVLIINAINQFSFIVKIFQLYRMIYTHNSRNSINIDPVLLKTVKSIIILQILFVILLYNVHKFNILI